MMMRNVTFEDAKLLFDWANDFIVRQNSFSTDMIEWAEHIKWLEEKLINPNCDMYLFFKNEVPVGVIRFDYTYVSIIVDPLYRDKGIGTEILKQGCREYMKNSPFNPKAKIKCSNGASLKMFRKMGFKSTYVHMKLSVTP